MPSTRGRSHPDEDPSLEGLVGHVSGNAVGRHLFADPQRLFADPDPGPDEVSFHQPNVDAKYYNTGYYAAHQSEIQPFPCPLPDPPRIDLATILGPNLLGPIEQAKTISFHAVGDTGASSSALIAPEARVADALAAECPAARAPSPPTAANAHTPSACAAARGITNPWQTKMRFTVERDGIGSSTPGARINSCTIRCAAHTPAPPAATTLGPGSTAAGSSDPPTPPVPARDLTPDPRMQRLPRHPDLARDLTHLRTVQHRHHRPIPLLDDRQRHQSQSRPPTPKRKSRSRPPASSRS